MKNSTSYQSYLKSPYKSIKHSTYFECYDHFFESFRHKKITFVEIGVLGGGSLFMWQDYFGPEARIIGVDLNPNAKKWEENGFEIYIGNHSDVGFWTDFKSKVGGIDLILDDGGHTYEQQIVTTECLLDSLNDGGLLVVEDTHTSYMDGFGPKKYSFIEYVKNKIDSINKRFEKLSDVKAEKRFWSIEIIESMVAFKINTNASNLLSKQINNGGKDDLAEDYRFADNTSFKTLSNLQNILRFLKFFSFARYVVLKVKNFLINRKFSAKKYFD